MLQSLNICFFELSQMKNVIQQCSVHKKSNDTSLFYMLNIPTRKLHNQEHVHAFFY